MRFLRPILLVLTLILLLAGFRSAPSARTPHLYTPSLTDVRSMLRNFHEHGYNPCVTGLYVNWNAAGGNYNGTGSPDANPCARHDPLTDLRYDRNLHEYQAMTGDTEFASDAARFDAIVLAEFTGHVDPRGWVYDELLSLAKYSGNAAFAHIGAAYPAKYSQKYLKPARIDYDVEESSVLVQSGVPKYVALGTARLNALWTTYYSAKLNMMVWGTEIKTSQEGDIAIAYVRAGMTVRANTLLAGMQHLWDTANGGYDEGATLSPWVLKAKKTGGRQANILILAEILHDAHLQARMTNLILSNVYLPRYSGVVYEQTPQWGLYVINGHTEDWVTSEAMGITIESLLGV